MHSIRRTLALTALLWTAVAVAAPTLHFDAFLVSPPEQSLVVSADALAARGVRVAHEEKRLGVPTFVWLDGVPAGLDSEQTARGALARFSDAWRLDALDVAGLAVREVHQNERTGSIVRFTQSVGGVEVFRSQFDVLLTRQGAPLAVSGYPAPSRFVRDASRTFTLSTEDAASLSFFGLTGRKTPFRVVGSAAGWMKLALAGNGGGWQVSSARARRVYYLLADRLEPAYQVELNAGPEASNGSASLSFVFSARDGALLMKHDLTADASYRVWANPTPPFLPHDSPLGTGYSPNPFGTPNGFQPPFIPANLVTLNNAPFSRNDPWLPTGATVTTGNNVDAYADLVSPDGYSPNTIDLRPASTGANTFDYTADLNLSPAASATQRSAAVTQLFFNINFLHDWFYDSGFDEVAGNAQTFNYGRGGREGDFIRAEAQDSAGRNNANMSTPADGASPRMQMFVFDGLPQFNVTAPGGIAGRYDANTAAFGAATFDLTAPLSRGTAINLACTALPAGSLAGTIALVDRGTCGFAVKAIVAQNAGAIGVIIANNAAGSAPGMAGVDPAITIPVLSTTQAAGVLFRATTGTITVNMKRSSDLDRDGALDNEIVAHEWGHYLSNRLIGNASGLVNNQGRSMGEGWSDFVALLQTVRDEDRAAPGNNTFQGVYATAAFVFTGGVNNGAYFGIRRMPYSTDLTRNSLTLKHSANGTPLAVTAPVASGANGAFNAEVHNSGEVWAVMLWECYASLLNAHPFQEAQDRMKAYLVASLKLTPVSPTMLEARDALLAVAAGVDPADYARFLTAFAKRGAGVGALVADRNVADHVGVVESFDTGSVQRVLAVTLGDDVVGCDQDGVLDVNETGTLRVRVWNQGRTPLAAQTMTVTASGATATFLFPTGNTATVPALPPGATATISVRLQLSGVTGATPRAGLTLGFSEPTLPAAYNVSTYDGRVHFDEQVGLSPSDDMESRLDTWLLNGFTRGAGVAHASDPSVTANLTLTSPWVQVNAIGNFIFAFKERHSFEWDGTRFWDGAVLEFSTDGLTWLDPFVEGIANPGYTGNLEVQEGLTLSGRPAFVNQNTGFPNFSSRSVNFGTALAGERVRFRFLLGSDGSVGAYGMDIDDVVLTNAANTPFSSLVLEPGGACNRRPVAVTGNVSAVEGTLASNVLTRTPVQLNGTSSQDPDGSPLTYSWTQVGGPAVTLTGASTAAPSFTATIPANTLFTFQLVVNDGIENSVPARAEVFVTNVNQKPVAVATAPATIAERSAATVTLTGTASTDADGEPLTYAWTQTAGPAAVLSDATIGAPTFDLPEVTADTTFTFSLLVNDGLADSAAPALVSVIVTNVDRAPTVSAGADLTAAGRVTTQLTAVGSDADGDAITYAWTQLSGATATLTNAATATVTVGTPDVKPAEDLVFQVTATANGATGTDTVTVHVLADQPPTVNAGADFTATGRTATTLNGLASDPEADAPVWAWTQVSGATVTLTGANTATPSFTSPDLKPAADLVFQATVTANGLSGTDTVTVHVLADQPPSVNAGADFAAAGRTLAVLGGSASDPESDALVWAWTQVSGATVTLTGGATATPSFTSPDVKTAEPLVFQGSVTANGLTATDSVTVTVAADRAPVVSLANTTAEARASVMLAASAVDPEGDALVWAWTQTSGPTVTLAGADTAAPTFTAPDVASGTSDLVFHAVVTANGLTGAGDLTVTVRAVNRQPVVAGLNDVTENERVQVTLTASALDPDQDALTWKWAQTGGPVVTLSGDTTEALQFTTPDVTGDTRLAFSVEAKDATGASSTATVQVTVKNVNRAPTAVAASTGTVSGERAVLSGADSTDPDGDAIVANWTQTAGPTVELVVVGEKVATFVAPKVDAVTELTFELTVTDGTASATASTVVSVQPAAKVSGCGCTTGVEGLPFGLLALALRLLSRRRR